MTSASTAQEISELAITNQNSANMGLSPQGGTAMNQRKTDTDPLRSKTYTKSFSADASDKIILSNSYGQVQVKTWNKMEAKIDVEIKAYSKTENEAQKLLDGVNIAAEKQGNEITFRTNINGGNFGREKNEKSSFRREVHVNCVLYLPATNSLTMSNQYGNIVMGDFSGPLYAKAQYGNFTAGKLLSDNNYVSVQYGKTDIIELNKATLRQQYGSGMNIGTVRTLDLDAQYAAVNIGTIRGDAIIKQQYGSGLNIGTVNNIELNAQYAGVNITTVKGNAKMRQQYNNLNIGSVGAIDLVAQYTSANIGTLNGAGKFKMDYNKLTIANVTDACKTISIDGDYLGTAVAFNDKYNAEFEVNTNYASFKYGGRIASSMTSGSDNSNSKHYAGKIGDGSGAKVNVRANYGSVTFE